MFQINQPEASCDWHMCPRRISHQKFPKRRRILSILSKAHSFHSLHSDIGRMNGTILRSFQKRNSSQKKKKHKYRLFRVFLFWNKPKRMRPRYIVSFKILPGQKHQWFSPQNCVSTHYVFQDWIPPYNIFHTGHT